jgi:hypothetical protein
MSAVILTITGVTADDNGVSASQVVPALVAGNAGVGVVIDGAYSTGYDVDYLATASATMTQAAIMLARGTLIWPPRQVVVASDGDESNKTIAIVGKGPNGEAQKETITGPNASRTATTKFFSNVTSATFSATSTGTASIGINGIATMAQPRRVAFTPAGADTGMSFLINGADSQGSLISETVTGGGSTAVWTKLAYKTITSIIASNATASTLIVGDAADSIAGNPAYSAILFPDLYLNPFNIGIGAMTVTGTATFAVQHTFDDIDNNDISTLVSAKWADNTGITGKSASDALVSGNYAYPVSGIRLALTSGTGTVKAWLRQAGTR